MFGLLLAIVDKEYHIRTYTEIIDIKTYPDANMLPRVTDWNTDVTRISITITTVMAMMCLIIHQYYNGEWMETYFAEGSAPDPSRIEFLHYETEDKFMSKKKKFGSDNSILNNFAYKKFFFEMFILMVQPIPYWDMYVEFDIDGQ